MSVLIVLAIAVLAATLLLIVASFVTTADQSRDPAPAEPGAEHPTGPDRRAGGPGFRKAALRAASDPPAGPAQRRRLSSRRRRALEAAQAAHVADLATGDDA